jgi:hypothetical protein
VPSVTPLGAGIGAAVTALDAAEDGPLPDEVFAFTVKVYD